MTTARNVLASDGPYDTACFHAQQAAEKYLKGLLAFHEQPISRIHDLTDLGQACASIERRLGLAPASLALLTPYAVELRYDLDFWPDEDAVREAIDASEQVRSAVLALVPQEAWP